VTVRTSSPQQFAAKIRPLADAAETGRPLTIHVAGEVLHIPAGAVFNVEHERGADDEEVEFQLRWKRYAHDARRGAERHRRQDRGGGRRRVRRRPDARQGSSASGHVDLPTAAVKEVVAWLESLRQ
jgi:hypothetical protein